MFDEQKAADLYRRTFGQAARSICVVAIDEECSAREVAAKLVLQGNTTARQTILIDIVSDKANNLETEPKTPKTDCHFSRLEPHAVTSIKATDQDIPLNSFFDGTLKQYDQFVVALPHGHNKDKIGNTLNSLGDFDGVILTVADSENIRDTLPDTISQLKKQNIKVAGLAITSRNEPTETMSNKQRWPQVNFTSAWRRAALHLFGQPA